MMNIFFQYFIPVVVGLSLFLGGVALAQRNPDDEPVSDAPVDLFLATVVHLDPTDYSDANTSYEACWRIEFAFRGGKRGR